MHEVYARTSKLDLREILDVRTVARRYEALRDGRDGDMSITSKTGRAGCQCRWTDDAVEWSRSRSRECERSRVAMVTMRCEAGATRTNAIKSTAREAAIDEMIERSGSVEWVSGAGADDDGGEVGSRSW